LYLRGAPSFSVLPELRVQYWRLLSNFMYFGNWGIDFLFNMYFL